MPRSYLKNVSQPLNHKMRLGNSSNNFHKGQRDGIDVSNVQWQKKTGKREEKSRRTYGKHKEHSVCGKAKSTQLCFKKKRKNKDIWDTRLDVQNGFEYFKDLKVDTYVDNVLERLQEEEDLVIWDETWRRWLVYHSRQRQLRAGSILIDNPGDYYYDCQHYIISATFGNISHDINSDLRLLAHKMEYYNVANNIDVEKVANGNLMLPLEIWNTIWDLDALSLQDLCRFSEVSKEFYFIAHNVVINRFSLRLLSVDTVYNYPRIRVFERLGKMCTILFAWQNLTFVRQVQDFKCKEEDVTAFKHSLSQGDEAYWDGYLRTTAALGFSKGGEMCKPTVTELKERRLLHDVFPNLFVYQDWDNCGYLRWLGMYL
eukprot:m.344306 g.344306  ORF g.344306 m.344306 type:complete len:371 (-) comp24149_c0_seq1:18-1130(-)